MKGKVRHLLLKKGADRANAHAVNRLFNSSHKINEISSLSLHPDVFTQCISLTAKPNFMKPEGTILPMPVTAPSACHSEPLPPLGAPLLKGSANPPNGSDTTKSASQTVT